MSLDDGFDLSKLLCVLVLLLILLTLYAIATAEHIGATVVSTAATWSCGISVALDIMLLGSLIAAIASVTSVGSMNHVCVLSSVRHNIVAHLARLLLLLLLLWVLLHTILS